MAPLRVLVVEDHPLFRKGVVALLDAVPDLAVAGIAVTVEDDGAGPDPEHVRPGGGHGLVGMRERATSCGGRFGIDRSALGGWRVRAWFPGTVMAAP